MEITSVLGIIIAIASLLIAFVWDGGHILALLAPSAALIVFGGTIGATVTTFSKTDLTAAMKMLKTFMFKNPLNKVEMIEDIVDLAEKARREGILYLENQLTNIESPFMRKGIQLIVDGTSPELVRTIMETEIYTFEEQQEVGASVFEVAGGYAPTMGIIGTVMGLVHVLGNLSDPGKLGPSIAMAFIATLYGVGSANILWLPIAGKLKNISKEESKIHEMMLEGLLSIQAGNNPVLIRERLTAFLDPRRQERDSQEKKAEVDEEE